MHKKCQINIKTKNQKFQEKSDQFDGRNCDEENHYSKSINEIELDNINLNSINKEKENIKNVDKDLLLVNKVVLDNLNLSRCISNNYNTWNSFNYNISDSTTDFKNSFSDNENKSKRSVSLIDIFGIDYVKRYLKNNTMTDMSQVSTKSQLKPNLSFVDILKTIFLDNLNNKLTLTEIYTAIQIKYPYFQNHESWKNSIRHNLSINKIFIKIPKNDEKISRGGYWALDSEYYKQLNVKNNDENIRNEDSYMKNKIKNVLKRIDEIEKYMEENNYEYKESTEYEMLHEVSKETYWLKKSDMNECKK